MSGGWVRAGYWAAATASSSKAASQGSLVKARVDGSLLHLLKFIAAYGSHKDSASVGKPGSPNPLCNEQAKQKRQESIPYQTARLMPDSPTGCSQAYSLPFDEQAVGESRAKQALG